MLPQLEHTQRTGQTQDAASTRQVFLPGAIEVEEFAYFQVRAKDVTVSDAHSMCTLTIMSRGQLLCFRTEDRACPEPLNAFDPQNPTLRGPETSTCMQSPDTSAVLPEPRCVTQVYDYDALWDTDGDNVVAGAYAGTNVSPRGLVGY